MPPDEPPSETPEPTATGTLIKTPLAHLLVYAHDRELTGTFEFEGPAGQRASVLFIEGQPTKARTNIATIYLGRVLFELGILTEEQLGVLLPRLLGSKELHGQVLLGEALITEEQLELGLRAQLVRQMQALVRLPPETAYRYYDCFDGLASYGGDGHVGIDPYPLVWACIRDEPPWDHVSAGLAGVGAAGVRLTDAAETLRFSFDRTERAALEVLRQKPWRIAELAAMDTVAPRLAQLLVYCLLVTKQVELVRPSKIPGAAPPEEEEVPDAPPSSPFSGNPMNSPPTPAQRTVARVQLLQRPVTRTNIVVDDTSAGRLTPEGEDGSTSYTATQPRTFKKRPGTNADALPRASEGPPTPPAEGQPPPQTSEDQASAAHATEAGGDEPPSAPAAPAADVAAQAPDAEVSSPSAEPSPEPAARLSSDGTTNRPPPPEASSAEPDAGGDLSSIPTPARGVDAVTAALAADPQQATPAPETLAAAPEAEDYTRPTLPKLKALTDDQIAAHRAASEVKPKGSSLVVPTPLAGSPISSAIAEALAAASSSTPARTKPSLDSPVDMKTGDVKTGATSAEAGAVVTLASPPPSSSPGDGPLSPPPSARASGPVSAPGSGPSSSPSRPRPPPISLKEVHDDDELPSSRAGHGATRAMQMTGELAARKKEIQEKAAALDKEDHFALLGVTRDTTTAEIQKAFFTLAKKWHPDRVPPALADVKDLCAKVFGRMSEAHQTLMDPAKRAKYEQSKKKGSDDSPEAQAQVMAILEAATNFQKAEICLKRNDFKQAEEFCRKAIAVEPKQADYISMLAWLDSMKPNRQDPSSTQAQVAELTRAIGISQACERGFFYRAMLQKRLGQDAAAFKDFKRAMELNPRNVDAQREVRLYNMRSGAGAGPSKPPGKPKEESGGIFGRLFKK